MKITNGHNPTLREWESKTSIVELPEALTIVAQIGLLAAIYVAVVAYIIAEVTWQTILHCFRRK